MSQCYEFNYTSNQPQLLPDVWIPCPIGDNCCIGTDICLSNNVCHHMSDTSKDKRDASYSGFYNARCTDPTYTNPACDKICVGWPPDIVYNYTSDLWACCGNNTAGQVTCSNPLDQYYEAPAPDQLTTLSSGGEFASTQTLTPYISTRTDSPTTGKSSITTSIPVTTGVTTGQPTSSAQPEPVVSRSNGLSSGVEAGIGVGVAVTAIGLILAGVFWIRQRNKNHRQADMSSQNFAPQHGKRIETPLTSSDMPGSERCKTAEMDSEEHKPLVELA